MGSVREMHKPEWHLVVEGFWTYDWNLVFKATIEESKCGKNWYITVYNSHVTLPIHLGMRYGFIAAKKEAETLLSWFARHEALHA